MMDIDAIVADLNNQIQALEDAKTAIMELQDQTRDLIATVNKWFDENIGQLPEVK